MDTMIILIVGLAFAFMIVAIVAASVGAKEQLRQLQRYTEIDLGMPEHVMLQDHLCFSGCQANLLGNNGQQLDFVHRV